LADKSGYRAIREALAALSVGVAVLLLATCTGRPSDGQWILEAYDKDKGFTFVHDGGVYHARCIATGRPMLAGGKPDLDPGALPPVLAHDESACGEVLPYLHKPVPSFTRPYPSILLFVGKDNWRLEFEIAEAK
jgi:hypothetical protein